MLFGFVLIVVVQVLLFVVFVMSLIGFGLGVRFSVIGYYIGCCFVGCGLVVFDCGLVWVGCLVVL